MSNFVRSLSSSKTASFHSSRTHFSNRSQKSISPELISRHSSTVNRIANDFIRLNQINSPGRRLSDNSLRKSKSGSQLNLDEMKILR